jgi:hypothetical protein
MKIYFALLAGCWIEPIAAGRTFIPALGYPMMALVLVANALRWWSIATLGPGADRPFLRRARPAAARGCLMFTLASRARPATGNPSGGRRILRSRAQSLMR